MKDFSVMYIILHSLQESLDQEKIDGDALSPEALGVSVPQWVRVVSTLACEGLMTGADIQSSCEDPEHMKLVVTIGEPMITAKGLEYLELSDTMRKAANEALVLSEAETRALVRELEKREGVVTEYAEPHQDKTISVNGPAIILTVYD